MPESRTVRHNGYHATENPEVVRRLIGENPWGTLVSQANGGLVASHYPILLEEGSDELAVVTHVGRPDEEVHELGDREILLIVQGRHGYISPSWYAPGAIRAPTLELQRGSLLWGPRDPRRGPESCGVGSPG
jgi:transcriptional regulator